MLSTKIGDPAEKKFVSHWHKGWCWRQTLCLTFCSDRKTHAVSVASTLASHWKISSSRLFTNLHFAYDKALSGSHSKAVPWNSIKHSVACHSQTGLWVSTLPLFPCHWYAHIQITRPLLDSLGPTSISFFSTASFNDFITHRQAFFFFFSPPLGSSGPKHALDWFDLSGQTVNHAMGLGSSGDPKLHDYPFHSVWM